MTETDEARSEKHEADYMPLDRSRLRKNGPRRILRQTQRYAEARAEWAVHSEQNGDLLHEAPDRRAGRVPRPMVASSFRLDVSCWRLGLCSMGRSTARQVSYKSPSIRRKAICAVESERSATPRIQSKIQVVHVSRRCPAGGGNLRLCGDHGGPSCGPSASKVEPRLKFYKSLPFP